MGFVSATIRDVADTREFEFSLPDDAQVQSLAQRVAEILHYPLCGCDGYPLHYGFIARGGRSLDPHACIRDIRLSRPIELRIVPLFTTNSSESDPDLPAGSGPGHSFKVELLRSVDLVHDEGLNLQPDVRIDEEVFNEIERFATEDRFTECAGLLLGEVSIEGSERVIHIRAAAPAAEADGNRTSVRMTLAAWESALWTRDAEYSHLRTLGWFHTHPGAGIFVSDADVFVHKHFFGNENMVAYVLDPTTGRDGFFYWHNNLLALRPNYGLVCTVNRRGIRERLTPSPKLLRALLVILVLGALLYLGARISGNRTHQAPPKPRPAAAKNQPSPATAVKAPSDRIYTIRRGDNLWIVCNRFYGDGDLAQALARYNGIRSTSGVQVGTRIKLPPKERLKRLSR